MANQEFSGGVPKAIWRDLPGGFQTRMGEAWKLRSALNTARDILHAQDTWCEKAEILKRKNRLCELEGEAFPFDFQLQTLVGILPIRKRYQPTRNFTW
jgi:hypothetical protein